MKFVKLYKEKLRYNYNWFLMNIRDAGNMCNFCHETIYKSKYSSHNISSDLKETNEEWKESFFQKKKLVIIIFQEIINLSYLFTSKNFIIILFYYNPITTEVRYTWWIVWWGILSLLLPNTYQLKVLFLNLSKILSSSYFFTFLYLVLEYLD